MWIERNREREIERKREIERGGRGRREKDMHMS